MFRTVWSSDTDLNGLETVARIVKDGDTHILEVASNNNMSILKRLKVAWRILTGQMSVFSFVLLSDKDTWVRGLDNGREDS